MCEKEMELDALRERLAIVSKERDEISLNYGRLREKTYKLCADNMELIDSKAKLRREKNFWYWAFVAMTSVAVFEFIMWLGGSV